MLESWDEYLKRRSKELKHLLTVAAADGLDLWSVYHPATRRRIEVRARLWYDAREMGAKALGVSPLDLNCMQLKAGEK